MVVAMKECGNIGDTHSNPRSLVTLRTSPPRSEGQNFDLKINPNTKLIDHVSDGLSLFKKPKFENGGW